jgi:SAM-dependent methyltransferase
MPDWEERIRADSHPALRLEHVVRYQAAASIILESDVWCDLGCGTGTGSAEPLQRFRGRAVLVDLDARSVAEAGTQFPLARTQGVIADLGTAEGLESVRAALLSAGRGCITCFEVIEHLPTFSPLIAELVRLVHDGGFTVIVSVPNDDFWNVENPYHLSHWGEGAFEELTSSLPEGYVVAHQAALSGSCIVTGESRVAVEAEIAEHTVPTHFLVAFGSAANRLGTPARLTASDLDGHRAWERQREADLVYFKALAEESGHTQFGTAPQSVDE